MNSFRFKGLSREIQVKKIMIEMKINATIGFLLFSFLIVLNLKRIRKTIEAKNDKIAPLDKQRKENKIKI